jgi:hypothetical protein
MQNEDTSAAAPREPVWYITKEKSLVGNDVHEAGTKVLYDGLPAENLEPTCDVGRGRYQEYLASNAERVAKLQQEFSTSAVGDPAKFATDFAKVLAEQQAEHNAQMAALVAQNTATVAMFTDTLAKLTGALQNIAGQASTAPATPVIAAAAAPATGDAAKPAAKGKADKPASDGDGLV